MNYYLRGKVSKIANIHPETLRYYETSGLIKNVVRSDNRYRLYPETYLPAMNDKIPPLLIVKAAKDKVKGVNKSIDNFMRIANMHNIKFDYIVHNTGGHSFDALDNNDETKAVIDKTLDFIKKNI